MDSTIIAAIIGAVAAIVAAAIGILIKRRSEERGSSRIAPSPCDKLTKKANTLRLGYAAGILDFLLASKMLGVEHGPADKGIHTQCNTVKDFCDAVFESSTLHDSPSELMESIGKALKKEILEYRKTYDIGFNLAVGFTTGIVLQTVANPGKQPEVEKVASSYLRKCTVAISEAALPKRFLKPIENLWDRMSTKIRSGYTNLSVMKKDMEEAVEQLAVSIEK